MLRVEKLTVAVGAFMLRDVSFTVPDGSYFVLLGASGVGKTVLLEALAGLAPLDSGRIVLDGEDITRKRMQRRGMGLVYQDQALFPHLTVRRNIAYGAGGDTAKRNSTVAALAALVGVDHLLARLPDTLSGGEAQRVALARALATEPRLLLLDEPLSALDIQARSAMRALLRRVHRNGQSVIHVTHDYEEALSLATHVAILEGGSIAQVGTPSEVFQHPRSEFVARFIGIRNVFSGTLAPHAEDDKETALFTSDGVSFRIMTGADPGRGMMIVRSEDVTLSMHAADSSAQNCFRGRITDIAPAPLGLEVFVDVGVEMAALVTSASVERLALKPGCDVWLSFKASAARFLEE